MEFQVLVSVGALSPAGKPLVGTQGVTAIATVFDSARVSGRAARLENQGWHSLAVANDKGAQ